MKKRILSIFAVIIIISLILGMFAVVNSSFVIAATGNQKKSAVQFLHNFYELRSEAVVNSSKASVFLNNYSGKSLKLKMHEENRINFYHNWIKQFNGTIQEMHSNIYPIKDSFQVNNKKISIKVYEWITILWTREKENIDVNNLPAVKELEALYKTTGDPLLKENLPYRIEELKKENENAPTEIVSGMGIVHSVTLLKKDNSWKILKDSYDEGPDLTRSPDSNGKEGSNTQITSSSPTVDRSYTNNLSYSEYYPQAAYDSDLALSYADKCVTEITNNDGIIESYYNLNYVDLNPTNGDSLASRESQLRISMYVQHGGGGDCANYVSQCLYAGGERMIKNRWYYDNHGTGITDPNDPNYWNLYWMFDDTSSSSWRYVPDLKTFITGYSRGTVTDNFNYVVKGDIVENGGHVMIVHGNNSNGYIYVDGHNNDRKNFPISYYWLHHPKDKQGNPLPPYDAIQMYHLYPLIENGSDYFFYPQNFPIVRIVDRTS